MSREPSTFRSAAASTVAKNARLAATEAALRVKEAWENADRPDLPLAVESTPDLARDKSVFLDLVQVELRLLRERGEQCGPADYCRRFPMLDGDLLRSVHRCVQVEDLLGDNDDLLGWLAEADWPAPGEVFDDFYLLEELGRGAVARVFLCNQASMGNREVVLKITRGAKSEAAIHGKLKHPNVLPVYSVGVEQETGLGWICMPYLGRVTTHDAWENAHKTRAPESAADLYALTPKLQDRRSRRESYEHCVLRVFAEIADGLASVHADGVLHGDLKPSNVLLAEGDGAPMLIDFNLARDTRADFGLIGGTLPYMAPEQLRAAADAGGEGRCRVTVQTEAFSFGVMLYQMLVGRLPYEVEMRGRSLPSIAEALLDAQAEFYGLEDPPLINGRPLDKRAEWLLGRLMAPEPRERPEDFGVVRDELRRLLSVPARIERYARRRPRVVLSVAVSLALTTVVTTAVLPIVFNSQQIRHAETSLAAGRHTEAIELLEPYVVDHPESVAAHRLLATSFLGTEEPKPALGSFLAAWQVDRNPQDLAMAAYCRNLLGQHNYATQFYFKAKQLGLRSIAVENNYAASLLQAPSEAFDQELSDSIEASLQLAYSLAPRNESVRISMFRHYELTARKTRRNRPVYPIEIAAPPSSDPSKTFCRHALLYLAALPPEVDKKSRYGMACLMRLAAIVGFDNLGQFLPSAVLGRYQQLDAYKDLALLPAAAPPPEPPEFLNPADEF